MATCVVVVGLGDKVWGVSLSIGHHALRVCMSGKGTLGWVDDHECPVVVSSCSLDSIAGLLTLQYC